MGYWNNQANFSDLLGKTLTEVTEVRRYGDEIRFVTEEGETYVQYHAQDCCENVVIDDVCGDLSDLVGSPILLAEEAVSDVAPEGAQNSDDENTWTFYKLSTIKGSVTIRWHGSSNGYYSTGVNFRKD